MVTSPETSPKTESGGTLFQALRSAGVEPEVAYRADDEVRNRAGQNVISVIGAKMDAKTKELCTRMDVQATALETKIDKQGAELHAKINKLGTELHTKIDAKTEELRARMDAQATALETKIDKRGAELQAKIDARTKELGARMDAHAVQIASTGARIDDLRVVMLRVIWPLIIFLAVPIFGELYRTLSTR